MNSQPRIIITTILLVLACPIALPASCFGETFSITELLNHDPRGHHIFTCEILATYKRGISFESVARVQRRYTGQPLDTVYINSGGGTTAGGQKLMPGSQWLIFSTTIDSLHYQATVCDPLSAQIKQSNKSSCQSSMSPLGKIYLEVLSQYEQIREEQYTGIKKKNIRSRKAGRSLT